MSRLSRDKGKRGEREFAALLREHGYDAIRGRQYQGSDDSPDVVCRELSGFHFEVKRTEALRLYDAMAQAKADCGNDAAPVVAHRKNNSPWLIVLRADDFFALVRESASASPAEVREAVRKYSAAMKLDRASALERVAREVGYGDGYIDARAGCSQPHEAQLLNAIDGEETT